MYLEVTLRKNNTINIREVRQVKEGGGKFKKQTVKNVGSFPASLEIGSEEGRELLREIYKIGRESAPKPTLGELDVTPEELGDFLNGSATDEEAGDFSLGVLFLDKVIGLFKGLRAFFKRKQGETNRAYDLYFYFRYFIFMQILSPGSVLEYFDFEYFYRHFMDGEPQVADDKKGELRLHDMYRFLDWYYENRIEVQKVLFENTLRLMGPQRLHILYYDGTNFYCQIANADPDRLNEFGETVGKGLRRLGVSKENRNKPLVSLGIISCDLGIPLFFTVFPGNEQEITHIYEDINNLMTVLGDQETLGRVLICADAGLYSGDLIYHVVGENRQRADEASKEDDAILLGRGVGNVSAETRKWMTDTEGYIPLSRGKKWKEKNGRLKGSVTYAKERITYINVSVKVEGGKTAPAKVRVKEVALLSSKRKEKDIKAIMREVEKAQKKAKSSKGIKKGLKKGTSKYLNVSSIVSDTGEVATVYKGQIDEEKVKKDLENAGLFLLVTSEVHWPAGKILRVYRDKISAEMIYKNLKDTLKTRPIYLRKKEHIVAHIDLCVDALILLSTIKYLALKGTGKNLSEKKIQKALSRMTASPIALGVLKIPTNDQTVKALLETFGIPQGRTFETEGRLLEAFSEARFPEDVD